MWPIIMLVGGGIVVGSTRPVNSFHTRATSRSDVATNARFPQPNFAVMASDERIGQTVEGLADLDPEVIVPMHCTGLATIEALQQRLPGRIIYNSAGTQYTLSGD